MTDTEEGRGLFLPALLAATGLVAGVLVHLLFEAVPSGDVPALYVALLALVITSAGLFGFVAERESLPLSAGFALGGGLVAGLMLYWNGPTNGWGASEQWRAVSLALAIGIAAPLFQGARESGFKALPYRTVHDHAWSNAVLWCAGWAFVGIVFLLGHLLGALFDLIGIDLLNKMLGRDWFWRPLLGLSFGLGLALLREHVRIVRLLQNVVMLVLGVLAPVLALGLGLFLLALPFTGLQPLWDATKSTTPILLGSVLGALLLVNAVIGNSDEETRRNPLLRWSALVLSVVLLPLAIIAAVATGLRIGQYGFTPERLWALTFVVLACAWGLAYLVSAVRARLGWDALVRPANLKLAVAVCGIALLLATPLLSFNAISTRDQVTRLTSGRIAPDKFDWAAIAFDFGKPGRAALERLAKSPNAAIQKAAKVALKKQSRYEFSTPNALQQGVFEGRFEIRPAGTALTPALRAVLTEGPQALCDRAGVCRIYFQPGGKTLVGIMDGCARPGLTPAQRLDPSVCSIQSTVLVETAQGWAVPPSRWAIRSRDRTAQDRLRQQQAERDALERGDVTIRSSSEVQIFIGDKPVNDPIPACSLEAGGTRC